MSLMAMFTSLNCTHPVQLAIVSVKEPLSPGIPGMLKTRLRFITTRDRQISTCSDLVYRHKV